MRMIMQKISCLVCISCIFMGLLLLGAVLPITANAQLARETDIQLEAAILKEDWVQVANVLGSSDVLSPTARLVKAHAYLALNKNNESLCLFLSVSSEEDLRKWEEWTQDFVKKNPKKAIAYYFRGDALARLEKWDDAVMSFNKALKLHPNHPMVLNARGVVYAAEGRWDEALVDFTKATILSDNFADAYASLGAMWVQRRAGIEGALKSFKQAIELSPNFALAYNGKGVVEYVLGHWEKANEHFGKAGKHFNCQNLSLSIVNHNLNVIAISAKRASFPFFSKGDFVNWSGIKRMIQNPHSILYNYFNDIDLPDEVNDLIVSKFNELLEIPEFYDENKKKIELPKTRQESNAGLNELITLIKETESLRKKNFSDMTDVERDKIRKLNRLILEYFFPKDIIQIAMNQIDSPGFSLERGITEFGLQYATKSYSSPEVLKSGINRMQNLWRPLADFSASIPIVGPGISNTWNRHLDNQIKLNKHLLGWDNKGFSSPSGGVDFNMRKAHIDKGNWGVGTWFGLAYHVEPIKSLLIGNEE